MLFNFPPNAGNTGSAAYLAVFPSLQRVLASLKEQGYTVELPSSADDIREDGRELSTLKGAQAVEPGRRDTCAVVG